MNKLLYVMLIIGLAALIVPSAIGAPLMRLSEDAFDFGFAPQNSKVAHVFWIYNDGDDTLKIEKVVPG